MFVVIEKRSMVVSSGSMVDNKGADDVGRTDVDTVVASPEIFDSKL